MWKNLQLSVIPNLEKLILQAVVTAHELWKYSFQEVFYHRAVLKSVVTIITKNNTGVGINFLHNDLTATLQKNNFSKQPF